MRRALLGVVVTALWALAAADAGADPQLAASLPPPPDPPGAAGLEHDVIACGQDVELEHRELAGTVAAGGRKVLALTCAQDLYVRIDVSTEATLLSWNRQTRTWVHHSRDQRVFRGEPGQPVWAVLAGDGRERAYRLTILWYRDIPNGCEHQIADGDRQRCREGRRILADLGEAGPLLEQHARELARLADRVDLAAGRPPDLEVARALHGLEPPLAPHAAALSRLAALPPEARASAAYALCILGSYSSRPDLCAEELAGFLLALGSARGAIAAADPVEPAGLPPSLGCDPWVGRNRSPRAGLSVDVATGWQDSREPVSHLAWSLGLGVRARLAGSLALGARAAWLRGSDAGADLDGDGRDDDETGAVAHLLATAGPRLTWRTGAGELLRAFELELGAGYARSIGAGESGPVLEAGLGYRLSPLHLGVRLVQGAGDADTFRAALLSASLAFGGLPESSYGGGCGHSPRGDERIPFAIGVQLPLSGWSLGGPLGYLAPGLALEVPVHLRYPVDVVARWDFLVFPGVGRDAVSTQTALAGARLGPTRGGLVGLALAGYARAFGNEPARVGSGPVVDLAIGYELGKLSRGEGASIRLHTRLGLGADNRDLRAAFLSIGGELRLATTRWYRNHPDAR